MIRRTSSEQAHREDHALAIEYAESHGLQHEHSRRKLAHQWDFYPFGEGSFRRARNVVHGALHGRSTTAFEYFYFLLSDSVEDSGYQRDSANWFLVCVVDLDHPVPSLAAVRTAWFEWHDDELPGSIVPIDHDRWAKVFTLVGDDEEFARAVVTTENASRCVEAEVHAEWRFENDELLLWVWRGRVDNQLDTILDVARPLIEAAERYQRG
ncbi:MAG: hypothetical protein JWO63_49 [Frankiales bacterium]|nr:hypothetical protein [Frankiales bacterium]